jgi:hypothetical protein
VPLGIVPSISESKDGATLTDRSSDSVLIIPTNSCGFFVVVIVVVSVVAAVV